VKDAVKATKSDVELLDALNKELVPPDLANDDGEVCAVEDIETEEDVAAATGDGEHLPVASTLTGWPEVPLPSVMPRPEGIALMPAGMGPPTVVGTIIGVNGGSTGTSSFRSARKGFKATGNKEATTMPKEWWPKCSRVQRWKGWRSSCLRTF
jgi:hypothetical protein